jgi:xylulose-5-phosphate/fructose-6-phosphate phosphoketolase
VLRFPDMEISLVAASFPLLSSLSFPSPNTLPTHFTRVYFPANANTATSVIAHCLESNNYVNLIVGTKGSFSFPPFPSSSLFPLLLTPLTYHSSSPVYLSIEDAEKHCVAGASIWENCSVDKGVDPDVVLVGIGL